MPIHSTLKESEVSMNIASNFSKETLTIPGVYQITNKTNGHKYIGSSINIWKRWGSHLAELRKNTHSGVHLQNAWNKYGEDSFEFSVLIFCDAENILLYEQSCLDSLKPEYNIRKSVYNSRAGTKATDETKAKLRESHLGNKPSDETRAKMSKAGMGNKNGLGYKHTDEAKAKISKISLGNKYNLGYKHTEESKLNMGKSKLGQKRSEETKSNISKALLGNKNCLGKKNNLGKKASDESKAKMSESQRLRRLREKDLS